MFKTLTAILLLNFGAFLNSLHLKEDLIHDRGRLNEHGVYLSDVNKNKLKMFEKYALIDLSGFRFSKRVSGGHTVSSWINGAKKIYEVKSVLPSASTYEIIDVETGKRANETNSYKGTFIFHTYIIDFPNQQRLIYQTQVREGLIYFNIGKKRYNPSKEDIGLGITYPNEKEILDLIN
ncbi:hypothetical protein ACVW0P_000500 [Mucilaginibacter sp. UYNi724]